MSLRLPLVLLLLSLAVVAPVHAVIPAPPSLDTSSHILIDVNSGAVLVEKNADERVEPASLTKLMTGYILSEEIAAGRASWDDMVTVSREAWAANPKFEGSSLMFIEVGTEVSLRDLYYGLVVSSGNDASVAIAEHIAGAEDAFADLMNQYAERLGMTNSYFVNAHGLPHPEHYTSARDMAILARARVLQGSEDYAAYSEREYSYNGITQRNRNELLGDENLDVDGLKTGYTQAAGYCLVASAEREGMRLVSVVMGAESRRARAAESRKLLQFGFRFYETRRLLAAGEPLQQADVWSGQAEKVPLGLQQDVWLTLPRGDFDALVDRTMVDAVIRAPLEAGQPVGHVLIEYEGEPVVDQELIVLEAVESAGFLRRIWDSIVLFFMRLLGLL